MKKISKFTILFLFALLAIVACEKDDPPVTTDNSLIIALANGPNYVIVSPTTGNTLATVETDNSMTNVRLGYLSQKALYLAKEPGGSGTNLIYKCDRETGDNLVEVTTVDWDVLFMDASPVSQEIVFAAQNMSMLSDDNIHKINEDGSGYQRLSSPNEVVDCMGISCKIWSAWDPCWSPNGQQIAFDLHLREVDQQHPHNGIGVMDANGNNKTVLYQENLEEAHYQDICYTQDGKYIVFLQGLANSTRARVLDVANKTVIDITNSLTVESLAPTAIWTSPNTNQIIFNKYEPGGGDLYIIDFKVENDNFMIDGVYRKLASADGKAAAAFGNPDWQLWPNNTQK